MAITLGVPCHDINSSTNKPEKPSQLKIDAKRIAYRDSERGLVVLKPIIDRLCFGFFPNQDFLNFHDPSVSLEEYKDHIYKWNFHDGKCGADFLSLVPNTWLKKAPYRDYELNLHYQPPGCLEPALIQIKPKKSSWSFINFSMNPDKFTVDAWSRFRMLVESMLLLPGSVVSYANFLRWCKVGRMDVAIELLGVRASDTVMTPLKGKIPSPHKKSIWLSKTGRIESIYPKASPGKDSPEYLYNKHKNAVEKGHAVEFGDFHHTRFECRVTDTVFYKLKKLHNRCARYRIASISPAKYWALPFPQQIFLKYAIIRNLEKALAVVPDELRLEYKKVYEECVESIWKPAKLWDFLPEQLRAKGIIPEDW